MNQISRFDLAGRIQVDGSGAMEIKLCVSSVISEERLVPTWMQIAQEVSRVYLPIPLSVSKIVVGGTAFRLEVRCGRRQSICVIVSYSVEHWNLARACLMPVI